jgi:peptidoglycan/LPS O-acetylase OafA/YrhL
VVAFHAFPPYLPGGYVGVDVFFVISGFLITAILLKDLVRDRFSLWTFYARRVRRIFPAFLVVAVFCLALGWAALLADEFKQLSEHLAAGAGFVTNLVLWSEAGYFDNASTTKPLMHLWSLGIEEQFYLCWPLLLWALWNIRVNRLWAVILIALVSFSLNVAIVSRTPIAAFYSPLTRAWELLLGAALALFAERRERATTPAGAVAEGCAWLGAALLAVALVVTKPESAFPGWLALLPTAGTALLVFAGSEARINRWFLSRPLLVGVGLISYPLYLWHWPLLSFARILQDKAPLVLVRAAILLIAVPLAWLTYRFVERPIRHGRYQAIATPLLIVIMAVVGVSAYGTYRTDGVPTRIAANPSALYDGDVGHQAFFQYLEEHYPVCDPPALADGAPRWEQTIRCRQSRHDMPVSIALVGDSHVEHLFIGVAEALPAQNVAFYVQAETPFLDTPAFARIFQHVVADANISTVLFTMEWWMRLKGVPTAEVERKLDDTLRALRNAGKSVVLTNDVPAFVFGPNRCRVRRPIWIFQSAEDLCSADVRPDERIDAAVKRVAERLSIPILDTEQLFCGGGRCSMTRGHTIMYRDSTHLNVPGSRFVGRHVGEALRVLSTSRDVG